jgi:hypothetical protein
MKLRGGERMRGSIFGRLWGEVLWVYGWLVMDFVSDTVGVFYGELCGNRNGKSLWVFLSLRIVWNGKSLGVLGVLWRL